MERLPIFGAKIYKPVLPQPNCLKISIKFPVNFISFNVFHFSIFHFPFSFRFGHFVSVVSFRSFRFGRFVSVVSFRSFRFGRFVSVVSFRWFRPFRFGRFVSTFRLLVHAEKNSSSPWLARFEIYKFMERRDWLFYL